MAINLTTAQVIYAAQSRLLELADIVRESSSFRKVKKEIQIGEALIRYIRVLQTDSTLTDDEELAITQHMIHIGDLYDFSGSSTITANTIFNFSAGTGPQGPQGIPGKDGGGTDYNQFAKTASGNVDTFNVTDADGAEWSYKIKSGNNIRIGRVGACWLSDGSNVQSYEYSTLDIGNTSAVTLSVVYSSGAISLFATIGSGTWDINGTRYFIPNKGAGTGVVNTILANGKIFIGNSINEASAQTITGDITLSSAGVVAIAPNVIVDADISGAAAISQSKLLALVPDKVVVTNSSGIKTTSSISTTKLGYLTDVTSNLQAQLDTKVGSTTGAISNIVASNLTGNRALISNALGKIAVHPTVSDTTLGYIAGLSSAAQTQLDGKQAIITGAASTVTSSNLTPSRIVVSDTGGKIASGTIDPASLVTVPSGSPKVSTKVINIGDWNMDTTDTVFVTHGLTFTNIRSISCMVRDDSNGTYVPNGSYITSSTTPELWIRSANSSTIVLDRKIGGALDSTGYDATGYNRGWITITYEG